MKKVLVLATAAVFLLSSPLQAFLPAPRPYRIGPEGRSVQDLRSFATPRQMTNILPNRPVVATAMDGSRQFFTSDGRLAVSINKDGSTSYSIGGVTRTRDVRGNISSTSRVVTGTNLVEVRNEFNQVTGFQERGFGGRVTREFDQDKNLMRTFNYCEFGINLISVMNEELQILSFFDAGGRHTRDEFQGNVIKLLFYDTNNRLMRIEEKRWELTGVQNRYAEVGSEVGQWQEVWHTTYFDRHQNRSHTRDHRGVIIREYNYRYVGNNFVIDNIRDAINGTITYFSQGRQTHTVAMFNIWENGEITVRAGATITDYIWNGNQLVCTFDRLTGRTTWFAPNGRPLYVTLNDQLISTFFYNDYYGLDLTEYLNSAEVRQFVDALRGAPIVMQNVYHRGRLIARWDPASEDTDAGRLTLMKHGREQVTLNWDSEPTTGQIVALIRDINATAGFGTLINWFERTNNAFAFDTIFHRGQLIGVEISEALDRIIVRNQNDEVVFEQAISVEHVRNLLTDEEGNPVISAYGNRVYETTRIITVIGEDAPIFSQVVVDDARTIDQITAYVLSLIQSGMIDLRIPFENM